MEKGVIKLKFFEFLIDLLDSRSIKITAQELEEAFELVNILNDLLLEVYESVRKFHKIVAECSVQ